MPTVNYIEKIMEMQDVEIKKIEKEERVNSQSKFHSGIYFGNSL